MPCAKTKKSLVILKSLLTRKTREKKNQEQPTFFFKKKKKTKKENFRKNKEKLGREKKTEKGRKNISQYCTVLHFNVLHCTSLQCTELYCTVRHHNVLHCTVLHYRQVYQATCLAMWWIFCYFWFPQPLGESDMHHLVTPCYTAMHCFTAAALHSTVPWWHVTF